MHKGFRAFAAILVSSVTAVSCAREPEDGLDDLEAELAGGGRPTASVAFAQNIQVDGNLDPAWSARLTNTLGRVVVGGRRNSKDLSASFGVLYDLTNLYVMIDVKDDTRMNDSPERWNDDGVELYFDMANNGGAVYDGDDFHYLVRVADGSIEGVPGSTAGIKTAVASRTGGYRVEMAIPWSTLNVTARENLPFGFDVMVDDDDNGGDRDAQLAWASADALAYRSPDRFGGAVLDGTLSPPPPPPPPSSTETWTPLSVVSIVDPMQFGAVGDGQADDQPALERAIAALPTSGGIVFLPAGRTFRKQRLLYLKKSHVKFWAPNRQATIRQVVAGVRRNQSILCDQTDGCGFFGVRFESDAAARFDALEDNQISTIGARDTEIVGCDIDGSAAAGLFFYQGTQRTYVEGNYVHHTWADTIHFTDGSRQAWAWDNLLFNEAPSNGDDGIACVTYGENSPRCGDMEWWNNRHLGNGWGRGYTVIGGDHIDIHDNFARDIAGAGIIVASEPSYSTPGSEHIRIRNNVLFEVSNVIGHPGILLSGLNPAAGPLSNIVLENNVVVGTKTGQAFRQEGNVQNVTNTGLTTSSDALPSPLPTKSGLMPKATAVMRTRDVSFVPVAERVGLFRIHVRMDPGGTGFQQRFEYVVAGSAAAIDGWLGTLVGPRNIVADGNKGAERFVALHTAAPVAVPATLRAVPFSELRDGDRDGSLGWLWSVVNSP